MMRYAVLGSGSCGNSYAFYDGNETILVDCGFSYRELCSRLQGFDIPPQSVRALFLTHLHPDHGCGAGVFARKTGMPVYMSTRAYQTETRVCAKLNIPMECLRIVQPLSVHEEGPFSLFGFSTTHDSAGSMGWSVSCGSHKFLVLTDTGSYNDSMVTFARDSEVLFLESNYDSEMLRSGPYPYPLKARIAGEWGHLSNDQAFEFLQKVGMVALDASVQPRLEIAEPACKHVYFIHLSDENNDPSVVNSVARSYHWNGEYTICERGRGYVGELC